MTLGEAKAFVKLVEAQFAAGDVDTIVAGYTQDVVVHFGDFPEMRGPAEVEKFLRARFARQRNYRLTKDLRSMSDHVISNYWEGTWERRRDRQENARPGLGVLDYARRQDLDVGSRLQRLGGWRRARHPDHLSAIGGIPSGYGTFDLPYPTPGAREGTAGLFRG